MSQSPSSHRLVEAFQTGLAGPGKPNLSPRQRKVIGRIINCGEVGLGAHVYRCNRCGKTHRIIHSCRDRHCPRCQYEQSRKWLAKQEESLLPVPYFHVVFTLPHRLNPLIRQNLKTTLDLLFDAAVSTLLSFFANNLGAQPGITAVLHTWGQTLCEHYHLHVLITGGGLSQSDDEWIEAEPGKPAGRWLFATGALAKVYQARYLEGLGKAYRKGELEFHNRIGHWQKPEAFARQLKSFARQKWNVYSKAPFAGPEQVLKYLSLYTHRVAISPNRVEAIDRQTGRVTIRYKDYADRGHTKRMRLDATEFTRRFAQHILPLRFCKIRHYGILSTRNRRTKIPQCRHFLGGDSAPTTPTAPPGPETAVHLCPHCQSKDLTLILIIETTFTKVIEQEPSRQQRPPPAPP